jgi:flagellar basal-body rod modification protein FlgD
MAVSQIGGANFYAPEQTTQNKELDRDAFLQLLVAQMQYQDPTEPTDNTQFVAQLAQYSSLEQLVAVNDNLESNGTLNQTTNNSLVASYIGKDVSVLGNSLAMTDGEAATGGMNLSSTRNVSIRIMDSMSNHVQTIELGTKEVGTHYFEWDGKNSDGGQAADGTYYFEIVSAETGDKIEDGVPLMRGFVEQVRFIDKGAYIVVDGIDIDPSNIYELSATKP